MTFYSENTSYQWEKSIHITFYITVTSLCKPEIMYLLTIRCILCLFKKDENVRSTVQRCYIYRNSLQYQDNKFLQI